MTTSNLGSTTPPPRGSGDSVAEPTQLFPVPGFPPQGECPALDQLIEALRDEQRERWRLGERVLVEEYLRRHPQLAEAPEAVTLIYDEFLIRLERGEVPALTEYQRRFPQHAARLQERLTRGDRTNSLISLCPPNATVTRVRKTDEPLPTVDGYELLGELGRGGMGVVYKARQLGLNRIVALKMVLGGPFAEPEFQARFQSEAEAIARLQHPNIVQVFAIGIQESPLGHAFSCPYFSQEYVSGGSLASRLNRAPQPPRAAARFMETLARAVHYAHEQGVVHRDLKPANILLEIADSRLEIADRRQHPQSAISNLESAIPKIGDFGLAKQLDNTGTASPTISGTLLGTPEYMAPEQARCDDAIGPAVDTYALGVILYEMLTGRRPFEGSTALDVLEQVRQQEPVPPRRLQARTPRDLETICLKCLHKEPARRYASALALAEDLQRFLAGEPIRARPVSLPERAWRWARRRPALAGLLAFILVLLLASAVTITAAWRYAVLGWNEADVKRTEAEHQRQLAEQRQEVTETNLYFSRITQADLARRLENPLTALRLLEQCQPRFEGDVDRRNWEWYFLRGLLNMDLQTLPAPHNDYIYDMAFSTDGQRLVTVGGVPRAMNRLVNAPDRVRVWQIQADSMGKCLKEFPHPQCGVAVAWGTNDETLIWVTGGGDVLTGSLTTGATALLQQLPDNTRAVRFSGMGQRYVAVQDRGVVRVWEKNKDQAIFSTSGPQVRTASLNPAGTEVALDMEGHVVLWDVATNQRMRTFVQEVRNIRGASSLTFSADGRLLALGTQTGQTRIWEVATGQLLQTLAGHTGPVRAVAFRLDGQQLATGGADHTVRLWDLQSGAEVLLLRGHQGRVTSLSFHPSGLMLASGSSQPPEGKIWDLTRPQEYLDIPPRGLALARVEALGFSADGTLLQTVRSTGTLQRTRTDTGLDEGIHRVDLRGEWIVPSMLGAFTPDGRLLAAVSRAGSNRVTLLDPATGKKLQQFEHPRAVVHLSLSKDGRRLATSATSWRGDGQRAVYVWDTTTGEPLTMIPCPKSPINRLHGPVALSPDGQLLAYDEYLPGESAARPAPRVHVCLLDLNTGQTRRITRGWSRRIEQLTFDATGRYLASVSGEDGISVYDCQADRWVHDAPLTGSVGAEVTDVAFSPDGQRLAGVSRVEVLLWDLVTGQKVLALQGAPPRPSDNGFNPRVVWSPDGRQLAASNWNNSVSLWDAADRSTPAAKLRMRQAAAQRAPALSSKEQ